MVQLALRIQAPIVSLRNPHAREFGETYEVPPPSTVYGMLLSMVGEEIRDRHAGVRLAIAMLSEPATSTVLRTVWRVKNLAVGPGVGENRRMDFQQLLTNVHFAVWVDSSTEREPGEPLVRRLIRALETPQLIERYGGLSLGESRDLVDVVEPLYVQANEIGRWLVPDATGSVSLPLWPDHVAGANTRWGRFRTESRPVSAQAPGDALVTLEAL